MNERENDHQDSINQQHTSDENVFIHSSSNSRVYRSLAPETGLPGSSYHNTNFSYPYQLKSYLARKGYSK